MQRRQEHDEWQGAAPFVVEISVKGGVWNGKMLSMKGDTTFERAAECGARQSRN
jgi:hypothetical protein